MDYNLNSRRSGNRRPCNPGCDCDSSCGMPPQNIMPPRPPMRPMPQPDCGGPAMVQPDCGCAGRGPAMMQPDCGGRGPAMVQPDCGCGPVRPMPGCTNDAVNNDRLQGYPVGMCYVPWQKWPCTPYELCRALQVGTIFPDLDKPFLMGRCARL